jgi:hypothetical protein
MILASTVRQAIAKQSAERGMSTLNKWITTHRDIDVVSKEDLGLAQETITTGADHIQHWKS